MKRIRKNAHRKIKEIAERISTIKMYSLDNGFQGIPYSPQELWGIQREGSTLKWINKELEMGSTLTAGPTLAQIHVHSNLWFNMDLK